MFSDLRGFTPTRSRGRRPRWSRSSTATSSEMTDAVMDHGGTLVAYMGDGIMAVFGAPIEQPDHADRAIAAAPRDARGAAAGASTSGCASTGHGDGFRMGIGLNSGEVMSGQVGSERRMEYTTIGDTTNTAVAAGGDDEGLRVPDLHRRFDP